MIIIGMQGLNNLSRLYYRAESGTKVITYLWGNSKTQILIKIYLAVYCLAVDLNLQGAYSMESQHRRERIL